MPRPKGSGKGLNKPITIRLPPDEEAFYRRSANLHGVSLSAYLTKTLVAGVIAENVQNVEERLQALIASMPAAVHSGGAGMSDDIALSVVTCEALLTAIVGEQDPQALYRAQDAARAKIAQRKGA